MPNVGMYCGVEVKAGDLLPVPGAGSNLAGLNGQVKRVYKDGSMLIGSPYQGDKRKGYKIGPGLSRAEYAKWVNDLNAAWGKARPILAKISKAREDAIEAVKDRSKATRRRHSKRARDAVYETLTQAERDAIRAYSTIQLITYH